MEVGNDRFAVLILRFWHMWVTVILIFCKDTAIEWNKKANKQFCPLFILQLSRIAPRWCVGNAYFPHPEKTITGKVPAITGTVFFRILECEPYLRASREFASKGLNFNNAGWRK